MKPGSGTDMLVKYAKNDIVKLTKSNVCDCIL